MDEARPSTPEPAPLQQRKVLFESLGVTVWDFRCRVHVHAEGPEEHNQLPSIAFIRRGVFRRRQDGDSVVADANHVLFFNPGRPYRVAHPLPGGDDCTVVSLTVPAALDLIQTRALRPPARPEAPFRVGYAISSTRAARLHHELLRMQRPPALAVEDLLAELAHEVIAAAHGAPADGPGVDPAPRAVAARRHRDLVEAAKLALNQHLQSPPSLGELGLGFACSPFHLSRTFSRTVGVSLRRYLGRLRVRAAADRLAAGAKDLTQLALELGFADHSHLTNAFRREWGVPPSAFRARGRRWSGERGPADLG